MSERGTLETLGKIITTPQVRDAVHIAVAPVVAGERLMPGDHVRLNENHQAVLCNYEADAFSMAPPIVTGVVVPQVRRDGFFTCSC